MQHLGFMLAHASQPRHALLLQASRRELAPANATARLLRRQMVGPHGGAGGRRLQRHLIHSRYRSAAVSTLDTC